jgi:LysM repeat protein
MSAARTYRGPATVRESTYGTDESRDASRRPSSRAGRRGLRRHRLAGLLRFSVFLLFIFIAVWAGVRVAHAGTDASVYTGHQYVVSGGDTLWSIAAREYGAGIDLRRAVYEIRDANGLNTSAVRPGERLTLPYEGD